MSVVVTKIFNKRIFYSILPLLLLLLLHVVLARCLISETGDLSPPFKTMLDSPHPGKKRTPKKSKTGEFPIKFAFSTLPSSL